MFRTCRPHLCPRSLAMDCSSCPLIMTGSSCLVLPFVHSFTLFSGVVSLLDLNQRELTGRILAEVVEVQACVFRTAKMIPMTRRRITCWIPSGSQVGRKKWSLDKKQAPSQTKGFLTLEQAAVGFDFCCHFKAAVGFKRVWSFRFQWTSKRVVAASGHSNPAVRGPELCTNHQPLPPARSPTSGSMLPFLCFEAPHFVNSDCQ